MAVALRLMRFGKKGYPTYRIVVLDKRSKRDGYYIEKVGLYNPMTDKDQLIVNEERFQYWVKTGAQVSEGIRKLMSAKLPKSKKKISKIKVKKVAKPKEEKAAAPAAKPAEPAPAQETKPAAAEPAPTEPVATSAEVKEDTAKTPPEPKTE
jgi:small subunit ribosomal protein S16